MSGLNPEQVGKIGPDPSSKLREAILIEGAAAWKAGCPAYCDAHPQAGKGWTCPGCFGHIHLRVKPVGYEGRAVCLACYRKAIAEAS